MLHVLRTNLLSVLLRRLINDPARREAMAQDYKWQRSILSLTDEQRGLSFQPQHYTGLVQRAFNRYHDDRVFRLVHGEL